MIALNAVGCGMMSVNSIFEHVARLRALDEDRPGQRMDRAGIEAWRNRRRSWSG